jgi:hypothetical protein
MPVPRRKTENTPDRSSAGLGHRVPLRKTTAVKIKIRDDGVRNSIKISRNNGLSYCGENVASLTIFTFSPKPLTTALDTDDPRFFNKKNAPTLRGSRAPAFIGGSER